LGFLQHPDVLLHAGQRHVMGSRQLADRRVALPQALKHLAPGRVCESCKDLINGRLILNHEVQYRTVIEFGASLASAQAGLSTDVPRWRRDDRFAGLTELSPASATPRKDLPLCPEQWSPPEMLIAEWRAGTCTLLRSQLLS
jgi:hypothetical protein